MGKIKDDILKVKLGASRREKKKTKNKTNQISRKTKLYRRDQKKTKKLCDPIPLILVLFFFGLILEVAIKKTKNEICES